MSTETKLEKRRLQRDYLEAERLRNRVEDRYDQLRGYGDSPKLGDLEAEITRLENVMAGAAEKLRQLGF